MARGPRPQTIQMRAELMMPRKEFDALEQARDERWERGQDPNVETNEDPEDRDQERGPLCEETIETLSRPFPTLNRPL